MVTNTSSKPHQLQSTTTTKKLQSTWNKPQKNLQRENGNILLIYIKKNTNQQTKNQKTDKCEVDDGGTQGNSRS